MSEWFNDVCWISWGGVSATLLFGAKGQRVLSAAVIGFWWFVALIVFLLFRGQTA